VRLGDLQVRITETAIGKVPLKDAFRQGTTSEDNLLMVKLELLNINPTKKVEYTSWAGKDISFNRDDATLKDNFGNTYKRVGFGSTSYPVGAVGWSTSVYPDKAITDVLVFEVPLEKATYLDLELPAQNYGGEGMVRFRIPMQWRAQAAARVADLKAKLPAAQAEAGRAKWQAEQARQQADQATRKAAQDHRVYLSARSESAFYQGYMREEQQAVRSRQEAESLVQKAQQAAAKARQADAAVAEARSALQQAEAARDRNQPKQTPAGPR
jgi:hypothetical protein